MSYYWVRALILANDEENPDIPPGIAWVGAPDETHTTYFVKTLDLIPDATPLTDAEVTSECAARGLIEDEVRNVWAINGVT